MTKATNFKPAEYHSVTASLVVQDTVKAIQFYVKAFGAQELMRIAGPDGKTIHAEIKIGDSVVMLADEMPEMGCRAPASLGGASGSLYVYVADVDAVFAKATGAGAKVLMPVTDMFWGDRFGQVEDPSGHRWGFATHVEDLSPEEIAKRQQQFFASMGQGKK